MLRDRVWVCARERKKKGSSAWKLEEEEEDEAVTVFEKIKKTVFFTRLSVFVIVILFPTKKKNSDSGWIVTCDIEAVEGGATLNIIVKTKKTKQEALTANREEEEDEDLRSVQLFVGGGGSSE